jgi:hypothetical protein
MVAEEFPSLPPSNYINEDAELARLLQDKLNQQSQSYVASVLPHSRNLLDDHLPHRRIPTPGKEGRRSQRRARSCCALGNRGSAGGV